MDIPFALILDILVAVLLVVTISFAVTLNKRLGTLRSDKAELQKLALSFGDATVRAEESTAKLRATTELLQDRIKAAESLREDLVFLVERGNGTADRLEELVRAAAPAEDAAPRVRAAPSATPEDRPAPDQISDAEKELLKALRSAG